MKLYKEEFNYYGLDHAEVCKAYNVDRYIGTFCVGNDYTPCAVYHAEKPNRKLGHKNYLLLYQHQGKMFVTGRDPDDMEKWRMQEGVYCHECKQVLYSIYQHDYRECKCGKAMIDGGRAYTRRNVFGEAVLIDHLTGQVENVVKSNT